MSAAGCKDEALRRLAEMPFLDRLELAAVSGWSGGAVYRAVKKLEGEGTVQAVPHASELISSTRRYCLTADGLQQLAQDQGTTVDRLLRRHPVSQGWRRILLERQDAVAVIYRLCAVLAGAAYPLRFRWYRAGPLDAGIVLPGGRHPRDRAPGRRRRPHRLRQAPLAPGSGGSARRGLAAGPR